MKKLLILLFILLLNSILLANDELINRCSEFKQTFGAKKCIVLVIKKPNQNRILTVIAGDKLHISKDSTHQKIIYNRLFAPIRKSYSSLGKPIVLDLETANEDFMHTWAEEGMKYGYVTALFDKDLTSLVGISFVVYKTRISSEEAIKNIEKFSFKLSRLIKDSDIYPFPLSEARSNKLKNKWKSHPSIKSKIIKKLTEPIKTNKEKTPTTGSSNRGKDAAKQYMSTGLDLVKLFTDKGITGLAIGGVLALVLLFLAYRLIMRIIVGTQKTVSNIIPGKDDKKETTAETKPQALPPEMLKAVSAMNQIDTFMQKTSGVIQEIKETLVGMQHKVELIHSKQNKDIENILEEVDRLQKTNEQNARDFLSKSAKHFEDGNKLASDIKTQLLEESNKISNFDRGIENGFTESKNQIEMSITNLKNDIKIVSREILNSVKIKFTRKEDLELIVSLHLTVMSFRLMGSIRENKESIKQHNEIKKKTKIIESLLNDQLVVMLQEMVNLKKASGESITKLLKDDLKTLIEKIRTKIKNLLDYIEQDNGKIFFVMVEAEIFRMLKEFLFRVSESGMLGSGIYKRPEKENGITDFL